VTNVEPLSLELDDIPFLQVLDFLTSKSLGSVLGLVVGDLVKVVVILELLLGDQVIVFDEGDWDQGVFGSRFREPGDLLGGLLEVTLEVELENQIRYLAGLGGLLGSDKGISPVHSGDLNWSAWGS